ncbi:glycoside hydrolase family 125 protein [Hymenobacter taeanensis]|uniref:Glycoside hydrolase family 125 protein n=1 Tax=Hymenobacter taeanensis TaxID=2735321 RepID=A0A6M6BBE2_9BACT|nr:MULTISPECIES: glycoside hydrolase family 125 protein [Hymenobacter]QJX45467.1 glycoside hydrolase family 125 protein [Hymenobacter taeanensis]UOQ81287.1 glycoside hydrolase family 125 protein [Hymenobacter sp. 5414T-23]
MNRRSFIQGASLLTAGVFFKQHSFASAAPAFPVVRPAADKRRFRSRAVEAAIAEFNKKVKDQELGWLFANCFPSTLDTTVTHTTLQGRPDTYVITGDIDAMWLRDSSAQVWPYLQFVNKDPALRLLIAGVINRQTRCIIKDPYANAFYGDDTKVGEWKSDLTKMQPGVHERKWEIDSLCYPIRLAYHYWKTTTDKAPFDAQWQQAIKTTLRTFQEQQRKEDLGPYKFQRQTATATDTQPMSGYGYPVRPVGLICSSFRPSDDATLYSFLIPSNFFAVVSLRQASEMMTTLAQDAATAQELTALANEVEGALRQHAVVKHPQHGDLYAYEVDGFGSHVLMDDANVPSLVSLPYLGALPVSDPVYQNTRRFLLSANNPFFFTGSAAEGIGGPHVGQDMIWPIAITTRGLTSTTDAEIRACVQSLKATHAGTGYMHESFHKNDASKFTRSWFAWANTIFGEFLWKVYQEKPQLLA